MKKTYGYIYKITNTITKKSYIGQIVAKKGKDRLLEHYRQAHYGYYPITKFRNALRKYKLEDFKVETIDFALSKEELSKLEKHYINFFDTYKNGYNSSLGGDGGCFGYKHTKEAKAKISENNSKRVISDETKNKMSKAKLGKENLKLGKKVNMFHTNGEFLKTFETIQQAGKFLGKREKESTIRRILDGRQKTINGFTFREFEDGYRQTKTDKQIKDMIVPSQHSNYIMLEFKNLNTGKTYCSKSLTEAARIIGIGRASLSVGIKKNPESYRGYKWKIIE